MLYAYQRNACGDLVENLEARSQTNIGESNKIIELGGVAWIRLAQYRDLWQAVVNNVVKF